MTKFLTLALSASAMALGLAAAPASAQVNGIATASPEAVVVQSQARAAAYQAINTQYAAQLQQATTLNTEMATLRASLDTDGDQQVSDAEVAANPTVIQQMQQKQQQSDTVLQPLRLAQVYVIEQLTQNYEAARNQVLSCEGHPDAVDARSDPVCARWDQCDERHPCRLQPTHAVVFLPRRLPGTSRRRRPCRTSSRSSRSSARWCSGRCCSSRRSSRRQPRLRHLRAGK